MMVQKLNEPKFPVIDEDPPFGKTIKAFRPSDWGTLAAASLVSAPFGYAFGRPILMRPTMMVAVAFGFTFGVLNGWQSSFARLTGYAENMREVAKFSSSTDAAASSATVQTAASSTAG